MRLVIGATGTNGRTVLDRLAKSGERTRALVRSPSKAAEEHANLFR
ncbi:NmrA family NAD(P)-binding protein [Singulisphaera sp. PoT]